jgi:hypothetical protein
LAGEREYQDPLIQQLPERGIQFREPRGSEAIGRQVRTAVVGGGAGFELDEEQRFVEPGQDDREMRGRPLQHNGAAHAFVPPPRCPLPL